MYDKILVGELEGNRIKCEFQLMKILFWIEVVEPNEECVQDQDFDFQIYEILFWNYCQEQEGNCGLKQQNWGRKFCFVLRDF